MRIADNRPWHVLSAYALLTGILYTLANHTPFTAPLVVTPSAPDGKIAFSPAAAVPYVTYLFLLPVLVLLARALPGFARVLTATIGCSLVNLTLCLAVPTRLAVRPMAPTGTLLAFIQQVDTPFCVMPSGHVSVPVALALAAWFTVRSTGQRHARRWRWLAALFSSWAVVLAASALLTKQHYLVDVLSGAALGGLTAIGFACWTSTAVSGSHEHRRRVSSTLALHWPTVRALAMEWGIIAVIGLAALRWWNPFTVVVAIFVIATRQHALLALYHDGVHGLVACNPRANDFVINLAVGVPMLLPIHLYRALHLSHHRYLGTERDPERVLLYRGQPWAYRPLALKALARQLAGDVFGWNTIVMAWRYFQERGNLRSLRLPATHAYPELIAQFAAFACVWGAIILAWPYLALRLALLWFFPYLTLTQLLQKVRSFAEHSSAGACDGPSHSWAPGLVGRLTIWPRNINYHREHHGRPDLPWDKLPVIFPAAHQCPGRDLQSHLWSGALR